MYIYIYMYAEVSPIGKIVQLISDLQAKVTAEGEAAQKVCIYLYIYIYIYIHMYVCR